MERRAIVMGGGMGGMLAAAALQRAGWRATLLERDPAPEEPAPRPGAPQGWHVHALLNSGRLAIEELFPGVFDEIVASGGVRGDLGEDVRWFHYGVWKCRFHSGIPLHVQTRPLLEWHLRRRLAALPGVEILADAAAEEPTHEAGAVTGVRLRGGRVLAGDLVVDATGRGSKAARWLREWGYGEVEEQTIDVGLTYGSRMYAIPEDDQLPSILLLGHQPPHLRRSGVLFRVEGGRWLLTLLGYHGEQPPTDDAGFLEYARGLARPDIHACVRGAEALSPVKRFTFPRQRWLRFDRLARWPRGFLPFGDAFCSFDPVFGQGMSAAAKEALALRRSSEPAAFLRACAAIIQDPWAMTSAEAWRWPEAAGYKPPGLGILLPYTERLFRHSGHDLAIYQAFLKVMHLERGPASLFDPRIVLRALRPPPPPAP